MLPPRSRLAPSLLVAFLGVLALSCGLFFGFQSGGLTDLAHRWNGLTPDSPPSVPRNQITTSPDGFTKPSNTSTKPLPKGITNIEGEGGRGIHRMVLKNGIWYPVYHPGENLLATLSEHPDPDFVPLGTPLNVVPLSIVSASPPKGREGENYRFDCKAVGGTPPYFWSMSLDEHEDVFQLDPSSGVLTGSPAQPLSTGLRITVADAERAAVSASFTLVITPSEALAVETTSLEPAVLGEPFSAQVTAVGGFPPYRWSMTASSLPAEWSLEPQTGMLSGTGMTAGDFSIDFTVTDDQNSTATQPLVLKVQGGLEITTRSPLLPAAPGGRYTQQFEAAGGTAPYSWRVTSGSLPPSWSLSTSGQLTGTAQGESLHRFTLDVADAAGLTFSKTFNLAIRDALIVVPSREKAGLAWSAAEMAQAGFAAVMLTRSLSPEQTGQVIYQGTGSNTVDRSLFSGSTLYYTLWGMPSAGGEAVPYARAGTVLLPLAKNTRATPGRTGDPFADHVATFQPLTPGGWGHSFIPSNVTGPPWISSSLSVPQTYSPANAPTDVASLHTRAASSGQPVSGSIVLEFKDNIIENGPGPDFSVFENVFFVRGNPANRFMEPAIVSVALFEGEWHRFPIDVVPSTGGSIPDESSPGYYASGFAGRNATTGDDPTDPTRSGGDAFDLSSLGIPDLTWVRFIKIETTGHAARLDDIGGQPVKHTSATSALSGDNTSGFDLDAVSAVNY